KLTDVEVAKYQEIAAQLDGKEVRLKEISVELDQLSSYVTLPSKAKEASILPQAVQVTATVRPSAVEVPEQVASRIDELKVAATKDLVAKIEAALVEAVAALETERGALTA